MSVPHPADPLPVGKLPAEVLTSLLAGVETPDPTVLVGPGIGRDAAALRAGGTVVVAKTDPITFAGKDAAAYLVDINANDLACLGAMPRWLLVTALLPPGTTQGEAGEQFAALAAACRQRGISLVGGHTEVTDAVVRTVLVGQLLGTCREADLLPPGGGRAGDRLLVSKAIAIEGTALLANERGDQLAQVLGAPAVERAARLLKEPGISVVPEAQALLAAGGVTALHDPTEGGLAMAVRELAATAGTGATVVAGAVPVLDETTAIARHFGLNPLGMLASGSLLAAVQPDAVERLMKTGAQAGVAMTDIGRLVLKDRGLTLQTDDGDQALPRFDTDEVSRALMESATGR